MRCDIYVNVLGGVDLYKSIDTLPEHLQKKAVMLVAGVTDTPNGAGYCRIEDVGWMHRYSTGRIEITLFDE